MIKQTSTLQEMYDFTWLSRTTMYNDFDVLIHLRS